MHDIDCVTIMSIVMYIAELLVKIIYIPLKVVQIKLIILCLLMRLTV